MAENNFGSAAAGSPIGSGPAVNPNNPSSGQPQETVPKSMYESLEQKLGEMGQEIGEFRTFFNDVQPLLDKLDSNPDLIQAILNDKITSDLAKAVLEGKVSVAEAKAVTEAAEDVKKEMGKKAFDAASPESIAKIIEDTVAKKLQEVTASLNERDELRSFEAKVNDFIANTSDFPEYADKVNNWLDEHPDVLDVETAYYAVKGRLSVDEAAQKAQEMQENAAREMAANMAGGQGAATYVRHDENVVDQLISGRSNPNVL
jgi:predicted transglutaminase-like cysteine proteinase